ncbi:hypothetical protein CIB84_000091 [Bambusicola thoracicus]|uniref:Uncharacterized protein n=1 Tax=Bambusicola thoracicus TaxID=9083 RepID=A0A2P4TIH2_BAMTH|nr:hypothetical protein CIB84_000091 [Bambusicola thoracicus]
MAKCRSRAAPSRRRSPRSVSSCAYGERSSGTAELPAAPRGWAKPFGGSGAAALPVPLSAGEAGLTLRRGRESRPARAFPLLLPSLPVPSLPRLLAGSAVSPAGAPLPLPPRTQRRRRRCRPAGRRSNRPSGPTEPLPGTGLEESAAPAMCRCPEPVELPSPASPAAGLRTWSRACISSLSASFLRWFFAASRLHLAPLTLTFLLFLSFPSLVCLFVFSPLYFFFSPAGFFLKKEAYTVLLPGSLSPAVPASLAAWPGLLPCGFLMGSCERGRARKASAESSSLLAVGYGSSQHFMDSQSFNLILLNEGEKAAGRWSTVTRLSKAGQHGKPCWHGICKKAVTHLP